MKKKRSPSLKIILDSLLDPLRFMPSLYAFKQNTMRSKHIEYVKVAARTVVFVSVIRHVLASGLQTALSNTPGDEVSPGWQN